MLLRVKELREAKGWNQTVLAYHARVSPSQVSLIETGKRNPTATTLKGIADALGVEVGDLFPKVQATLPLDNGEERGNYPYFWMSDALARLIDGWEQSIEAEQVDGRYAHAVAIAAMDTLGAVNLQGAPGETLRARGVPENEIDERNRVSGRLHKLCNRAIDRYRDSDVFESDEERRLKERWGKLSLAS